MNVGNRGVYESLHRGVRVRKRENGGGKSVQERKKEGDKGLWKSRSI